jgi:hypothetical protein
LAAKWTPPNHFVFHASSNPLDKTEGGVDGYESLDTPFTREHWGGLQHTTTRRNCLLNGSVGHTKNCYYSVGRTDNISTIPGPGAPSWGEAVAELWVFEHGPETQDGGFFNCECGGKREEGELVMELPSAARV